tara:strand:- start:2542 stop:3120 length:579 start_codon:yes stop_codon:yes gene_type:complete
MEKIIRLIIAFSAASILGGCAAAVVGGAAAGGSIIHDRRTTGTIVEDKEILVKAMGIRNEDRLLKERTNISIYVYNLRILLTGQAKEQSLLSDFQKKLIAIPRVRTVINEVQVGAEGSWGEATSDAYLTSKVKLALFEVKIKGFDPLRVKVITSQGTVFLMGLLTEIEAEAATEKTRTISGVKKVVRLFEYY